MPHLTVPVLVPILATVVAEDPLEALRHSVSDAKVIEEPLVAVSAIVLELLGLLALRTPATANAVLGVPAAALVNARLAELSWRDADTFSVGLGAGLSMHDAETRVLRVLRVVGARCGRCC